MEMVNCRDLDEPLSADNKGLATVEAVAPEVWPIGMGRFSDFLE